jgi:hypothetical protein
MGQTSFGERRAKWLGGRVAALALCVVVGVAYAWPASAVEFFEDSAKFRMNVDTTLSVGVWGRVEERNNDMIFLGNDPTDRSLGITKPYAGTYTNADDGNLNYDQWDVYSANGKMTIDLEMDYEVGNRYLLDAGIFARSVGFYDVVGNCATCTQRTDLAHDARRRGSLVYGGVVGTQWLFLDAYLDANFEVLNRYVNFRFGNQVLAWGQTIFYQGGINSINAIDVAKLRTPGSELREGLVPAPMIRLQADIVENLSAEAYYQFWWNRTEVDPTGSYFATTDLMGRAAEGLFFGNDPGSGCTGVNTPDVGCFFVGGIPKLDDFDPSNQGQGGVALRYYWDRLGLELAANYLRYHSKVPFLAATADPIRGPIGYHRDYGDKIDLVGGSFSFEAMSIQWGGEVSYRWDEAIPISTSIVDASTLAAINQTTTTVNGWVRGDKVQVQANFIGNLSGSTRWGAGYVVDFIRANNIVFLGEGVVVYYPDFSDLPAADYAAAPGRTADSTSGGYQLVARFEYTTPLGMPINLTPSVSWAHDVGGNTPGTNPIIEDRKAVSIGVEVNYLNRWIFKATYANFFGAGDANLITDRDFLSASVSFNF